MNTKTWLRVLAVFLVVPAAAGTAMAGSVGLRDNVGVGEVAGGDADNARWKSEVGNDGFRRTLVRALDATGLLERARGEGRFALNAVLESLEQPSAGFTATARVKYTLTDRLSGKTVFEQAISGEYKAKVWDSFMNPTIGREIDDGAVRFNASILADQLLGLSPLQEEAWLSR